MQDAKRKESAHGIIDDLTVGAVELSDSSEREGERNVLEKVGVSACIEVEVTFFLRIIAKVFLVLDAVVDHPVGEEDQVGGEWEGPGASDCCQNVSEGPGTRVEVRQILVTYVASWAQGPQLQG